MDTFAAKFPYQHPNTSSAKLPKNLRHLQYSQSEWPSTICERTRRKSGLPSNKDEEESNGDEDEEVSGDHSGPDDTTSASGEEERDSSEDNDQSESKNLEQDMPEGSAAEGAEIVAGPLKELDTENRTTAADAPSVNKTGHVALAAAVAARKVFQPYNTTWDSWEHAFKQLGEMGAKSWAKCDPEELKL
ncbi:hypothetical protein RSOL_274900, partial [Rhizoctonia solani AG-3 Rhs1AP]